jgi:hypothetical protein
MIEKIKLWLGFIFIVLIFIIGYWYTNLTEHPVQPKNVMIPERAKNVIDHGNGWYSFDLIINGQNTIVVQHFDSPIDSDTMQIYEEL